jgi:hypothetical protein
VLALAALTAWKRSTNKNMAMLDRYVQVAAGDAARIGQLGIADDIPALLAYLEEQPRAAVGKCASAEVDV